MEPTNHLLLTRDKLDVGTISELVLNDSCGAVSLFIGTTRNNFDGKRVCSLEYEAYEPMAIKEMKNICVDIRSRWPDVADIAIHHRIGLVPVKEASVVIAIASPHRQSALDAVSHAIEHLKQKVPIWKKELYEDDESTWKENKESAIETPTKCEVAKLGVFAVEEVDPIPSEMVQISAEEQEIDRRIKSFVQKKREDINVNNIMDYTEIGKIPRDYAYENYEPDSTSARTNTLVVKQEHSKCHLKVRRARNYFGPQTKPKYLQTLDKLISHKQLNHETKNSTLGTDRTVVISTALQKRLESVEDYLHLLSPHNSKHNVYARLKAIEDRILHLESISPEYWQFLIDATGESIIRSSQQNVAPDQINSWSDCKATKRKTYAADELKSIINQMSSDSGK